MKPMNKLAACLLPLALAGGVLLAGCTAATIARDTAKAEAVVGSVAANIQIACGAVNAAAAMAVPFSAMPVVGSLLSYATASCGSADAVAALTVKAVNDPSTVGWAQGLAGTISAFTSSLSLATTPGA